jgi:ribokinase
MNGASIVLVAGSLHYDIMVEADRLPRRDETAVGRRWYPKFGGKGGNQAVAVARSGARVRMLGAVGNDDFGRFLRAGLKAAGVEDRFVLTLDDKDSGMSVAILDAAGNYAATIVSGANMAVPAALAEDPAAWAGVGLLMLQHEIPAPLNLALASAARRRRVPVMLNAAPVRVLPDDLAGLIDILVVNSVEAEMMGAGAVRDLTTAAAAADRLARRFATVIVTAGAAGIAVTSGACGAFTIPAVKVKVASTHGAGDAFIGTLAGRLIAGTPLPEAARAAVEAAARHVAGEAA